MRTKLREQQRLFATGFANQPEVKLLEITKPAVDQLAGPARRSRSEITLLDQRDGESPGCGIERGAASGNPATDDRDIEFLISQTSQDAPPLIGIQTRVVHSLERLSRTSRLRQSSTWRPTDAAGPPHHRSLC
jgi:hypothetical protein